MSYVEKHNILNLHSHLRENFVLMCFTESIQKFYDNIWYGEAIHQKDVSWTINLQKDRIQDGQTVHKICFNVLLPFIIHNSEPTLFFIVN